MGSVAPDGSRSVRNKFSDWLYLGGPYADAMTLLCSPAVDSRNIKVLLSESGLGKTVLLHAALSKLSAQARSTYLSVTSCEAIEFLHHLLREMGSREAAPSDLSAAKQQFEALLEREAQAGKGVVLAIDNAQGLNAAALENLGALLDSEGVRGGQLLLILAGLPELQYHLADPRARNLRRQISGIMTLLPLTAQQKHEYIRQRWGEASLDLSPGMLAAVDRTEGIPRLLDQVLDLHPVSDTAKASILRFERNPTSTARPGASENRRKFGERSGPTPATIEHSAPQVGPAVRSERLAAELQVVPRMKVVPEIPTRSVTPIQQSRWEQLGWPAIFGITLCSLIPLALALFYFAKSPAAHNRSTQDPSPHSVEAPMAVDKTHGNPADLQSTDAATVDVPTVPVPSKFATQTASDWALNVESVRIPAQVGDAEAQYELGLQLASSTSHSDLVSAYAWLVMARTRGHLVDEEQLRAIAQKLNSKEILDVRYKLGSMFEKGIGCQPDPVSADVWYLLAASSGDSRSRSASTRLEGQMAKLQISDARKRAADWTRSHTAVHR